MDTIFNLHTLAELKETATKITNLCNEQVQGELMLSQKLFLAALIQEFIDNPIVKNSGILPK